MNLQLNYSHEVVVVISQDCDWLRPFNRRYTELGCARMSRCMTASFTQLNHRFMTTNVREFNIKNIFVYKFVFAMDIRNEKFILKQRRKTWFILLDLTASYSVIGIYTLSFRLVTQLLSRQHILEVSSQIIKTKMTTSHLQTYCVWIRIIKVNTYVIYLSLLSH